ncbi:hypothetical protein KSP40_PGU018093 [Platanthera guangdongensis]|uniref:Uncharacterized protein n=1 Tax=Platanthera guangdongensis TaxID=2320717 RepID=A0ABR2LQ32_9ASPA
MGTYDHVRVMRVGPAMDMIQEMKIVMPTLYQMSASNGRILVVDDDEAIALVFEGRTLEEVGRFKLAESREFHSCLGVGCMNWRFAIMWEEEGEGRVWDVEAGRCMYYLELMPGLMKVVMDNERYVIGRSERSVHVWDFGG